MRTDRFSPTSWKMPKEASHAAHEAAYYGGIFAALAGRLEETPYEEDLKQAINVLRREARRLHNRADEEGLDIVQATVTFGIKP
jgi:hypothetical protein